MNSVERYWWLPLVVGLTAVYLAPVHGREGQRVSIKGDGPIERCDQLDISFDDGAADRAEETVSVPATGRLDVQLAHHGGIALTEAPGRDHQITLCKAVPRGGSARPDSIRLAVSGSSVTVNGPASGAWVGYAIVRSPRGSDVSLRTTNGPVRVDRFEGTLDAQTVNGPLALNEVRGTVKARAQNGPVKFSGESGTVSVETQNGPISIHLTGTRWTDGTLEAKAHNGPLAVSLPARYGSGVEISSSGHGPWSCRGYDGCGDRRQAPGPRQVQLGDGDVQVRLSTVNGPVKVQGGAGSAR